MKSVIIKSPYKVELIDEDIPKAGPGEIVVEAEISGISSGTEMLLYKGTYPNFKLKKWQQWQTYPVFPGYELAGRVLEVGPPAIEEKGSKSGDSLHSGSAINTADTSEFSVGDRVICLGTHQQFSKVAATLAAKIPDHITYEQATLAVLGTTTMHSTRRLELEYGATVAVIGLGVVGNLALQHASRGGAAKTIGLDLDDTRLSLAESVGADSTINVKEKNAIQEVFEYTNHIGADAVVEASGAEGTLQLALELMRDRGTVELLGWRTAEAKFIFGDLYFKEGKIIATRAIGPDPGIPYSYVRWSYDQSLRLSVDMIADGRIKTNFFKPVKFSFKEIDEAYNRIDKNPGSIGLQAVLVWK